MLRFWFRFLFPNQSRILQLEPDEAWHECIEREIESYWGHCFERLCRDALPHLYRKRGELPIIETGEYWSREVQIDVVAIKRNEWIDLGECKWGNVKSWPGLLSELNARIPHYPNPEWHSIRKWLFTRHSRPQERIEGVEVVTLDDMM